VVASAGGEAAPERGKGVDDVSWVDVNLIYPKTKKAYTIDSVAINRR
jgi:hypothetical protein